MLHDLRGDYIRRPQPLHYEEAVSFAKHAMVWLVVSFAVTALVWATHTYAGLSPDSVPLG